MGLKRHMRASRDIYAKSLKGDAKGNDYFQILIKHFPAWTFRWWAFLIIGFVVGGIVVGMMIFSSFGNAIEHIVFG